MTETKGSMRSGMSLIEVVIAVGVSAIILLAIGAFVGSAYTSTNKAKDRTFAQTKATQILEEVLAYKPTTPTDDITQFAAEGLQFRLTTSAVAPAAPLSGNPARGTNFRFVRRVFVDAVPGDATARRVVVKIWYAENVPTPTISGDKPLALATGMVRDPKSFAAGVQVLDVYALSIENMPHVYRNDADADHQYMPSTRAARAAFEASLGRIEAANPGLRFRVQYIQRLSRGRDERYRPYMNDAKPIHGTGAGRDPLDYAYFYPGKIGTAAGTTSYYYHPDDIMGNIAVDRAGTLTNEGDYPLADQFNHAVRFPEEFDDDDDHAPYGDVRPEPVVPASYVAGTSVSQLSLRQFLEDMITDTTGKYRNALVVNLHGELLPALPLRNWADPAKMPDETDAVTRERRVVTHPYKLAFQTGEFVTLLTHAYLDNGGYQPSDTSSDSGNNVNVYPSWALNHAATHAVIVIKDIKDYIADADLAPLSGLPLIGDSTADENDVHIQTIQRERVASGSSNAKYVLKDAWPQALAALTEGEDTGRLQHSGPHVNEHGSTNHHHSGSSKPLHHVPGFGDHGHLDYPNADINDDDLVIKVSDLRFDSRQTTDGTSLFGTKGTSSAYDAYHTLYGRAYFPDPFLPFMSLASGTSAVTEARNSAQLVVKFKLKSTAIGKRFRVETRLWDLATNAVSTKAEATSKTWFYYGFTWDDTRKLYWDATNNRPSIPWTEQVQLVGDPRHNPYLDVRKHMLVNRYHNDFTPGQPMYAMDEVTNAAADATKCLDAVNPLITSDYPTLAPTAVSTAFDASIPGSADSWNGVKYNAPQYFRMWRQALMRNDMVFVTPTGEPIGLLGLGGEFKLDGAIDEIAALSVAGKAWITGTDAGDEANELLPSATGIPFIVRSGAAANSRLWAGIPWMGELYPSDFHTAASSTTKWSTRGNLPTGRDAVNVFYRESIQHLPVNIWSYGTDQTSAENGKRILNMQGLPAFLNAASTAGGTPLDVTDAGAATATQSSTGSIIAEALRMAWPSTEEAKFSYSVAGGELTPEWALAPYTSHPGLALMMPSSVSPRTIYGHAAGTSYNALNPLAIKDVATGTPNDIAVVVPSTLRTRSLAQAETVLDTAMTAAVESYYMGTRLAFGPRNVKPLPRIRISKPEADEVITNRTVPMEWRAKWSRADGLPFSSIFPNEESAPHDPATGEPLPVVYFVKYRAIPGGTWKTAKLTAPAASQTVDTTTGVPVYDTTVTAVQNVDYPGLITATWDASGLANGSYVLRVEAFRSFTPTDRTKTEPGHHAYQEIDVTLN